MNAPLLMIMYGFWGADRSIIVGTVSISGDAGLSVPFVATAVKMK